MHKFILLLSFLGITFLFIIGLYWPDNPAVWLASTSTGFTFVRFVLIVAFALLLVTAPPRSVWLRESLGLFALITAIWTIAQTYDNQMKFLDSLSLLEFSICTALTVLEQRGEEFLQAASSKKPAMAVSQHKKAMA